MTNLQPARVPMMMMRTATPIRAPRAARQGVLFRDGAGCGTFKRRAARSSGREVADD